MKMSTFTFYSVSPPVPLGAIAPLKTYMSFLGWTAGEALYMGMASVQSKIMNVNKPKIEPMFSVVISKELEIGQKIEMPSIDMDEKMALWYDGLIKTN